MLLERDPGKLAIHGAQNSHLGVRPWWGEIVASLITFKPQVRTRAVFLSHPLDKAIHSAAPAPVGPGHSQAFYRKANGNN
jgi:hypothetical protein